MRNFIFVRLQVISTVLFFTLSTCGAPTGDETMPAATTGGAPAAMQSPVAASETTELGLSVDHPAPLTGTVGSPNFEYSIIEVLRGEEAWDMVEAASPFNKQPEDASLEYILVKMHIRSLESNDQTLSIDPSHIDGVIGSGGVLYEQPSILDVKNPKPLFQAELAPSDEAEGWVTVLALKGETGLVLVIRPRINGLALLTDPKYYISIEP